MRKQNSSQKIIFPEDRATIRIHHLIRLCLFPLEQRGQCVTQTLAHDEDTVFTTAG